MRQSGCKPGQPNADSESKGSKFSHGKSNRVLHPNPLSEKGGVGSSAKTREGNRVLLASKEVSLADAVVVGARKSSSTLPRARLRQAGIGDRRCAPKSAADGCGETEWPVQLTRRRSPANATLSVTGQDSNAMFKNNAVSLRLGCLLYRRPATSTDGLKSHSPPVRRKRQRLSSNDPIETAPTIRPVYPHTSSFGAVPIGP
jgi:hypothetical protein